METLSKIADKSPCRYKHAAVVLYKDQVVSTGYNMSLIRGKRSKHAEINAVRKIPPWIDPGECILIVIRKGNFDFLNSKPCAECEAYIRKVGVGLTLYS